MWIPDEPEDVIPGNGNDEAGNNAPPAAGGKEASKAKTRLSKLQAEIDRLSETIAQGIEGERTWTTSELTTLKQQVADLKSTLETVSTSLPASNQLQAQLIQMQQEMLELKSELTTLRPALPTQNPPPASGSAGSEAPTNAPAKKNRLL